MINPFSKGFKVTPKGTKSDRFSFNWKLASPLLILLDVPKPDLHEWFHLRRLIKIQLNYPEDKPQTFWGVTTSISEVGADISLTQKGMPRLSKGETIPIMLSILEENIVLPAKIIETGFNQDFPNIRVRFEELTLEQERQLITLLFCRSGQWQKRNSPGELRSLLLLLKIFLRPKILFERDPQINAIKVAQV